MLFSELLRRKMENKHFDAGNIMSSAAAAAAIATAAAAAHIVTIALVAVACLPSLPSPSLLHTTPVTNTMAIAALALFVARHPHSPSPFPPSPSSSLPLTSAACSHCLLSPVIIVLWSLTLSCQPSLTFNTPVAS
jgi:hypothetical protein